METQKTTIAITISKHVYLSSKLIRDEIQNQLFPDNDFEQIKKDISLKYNIATNYIKVFTLNNFAAYHNNSLKEKDYYVAFAEKQVMI